MIVAGPTRTNLDAAAEKAAPTQEDAFAARLAQLLLERSRRPAASGRAAAMNRRMRVCAEAAAALLTGGDTARSLDRLARSAAAWAQAGIPVEAVLHHMHDTVRKSLDELAANRGHPGGILEGTRCLVHVLGTLGATVARAFAEEIEAQARGAVTPAPAGTPVPGSPTTLCPAGFPHDRAAVVLAVSIPGHPDENDPRLDRYLAARRKLRRVRAELAAHPRGREAVVLLSPGGGTVLLPGEPCDETELEDLVAALARAAQVPITAVRATAEATDVRRTIDRAHSILDIVERLDYPPGMYRFADFALEYQLSRPGPGRAALEAHLAPLEAFPELLETLRRYIGNNLDRQRTARVMRIHPNTLTYRLKRIEEITGLDPARPAGVWQLRSALIARSSRA